MKLHELSPSPGSKKRRRRVARGTGSGLGKTAGRGEKGQRSRSGSKERAWFEGGQMPLFRRLPKRGFKSPNPTRYEVVNVEELDSFDAGSVVTPEALVEARIIRNLNLPIKMLGDGELTKKLTVRAHKFSRSAAEKIASAGGEIEVIA